MNHIGVRKLIEKKIKHAVRNIENILFIHAVERIKRKDKTKPIYSLGGQFRSVENTKDLGVTISSDLSWGKHVFATVNKANMVLGIIKRSIGTNNQDVFSQLYKSLVRPILEYAAPVWSPYLIKDIAALEKVQRRASRLALRQKRGEMSYEYRCSLLKWQSLEKRREFLSLVQCYKIVSGIDHLSFPAFFELANSTRTRANHDYKERFVIATNILSSFGAL